MIDIEKIVNKCEKLKNKTAVAGISGGADSMFLLEILKRASEKFNFKLVALHVNHNLRGKESNRDQKFVENACKNASIELKVYSVDCKAQKEQKKESIEETARDLRKKCYENSK